MFKPSDPPFRREKRLGARVAVMAAAALVAAAGLLLQPHHSAAAAIAADRIAPHDPPRSQAPNPKAPATYQLRCWQHGRLLFDEAPVTLGAEVRQGAKLVVTDRNGAPLLVSVAGETTCQLRPHVAAPNLALPY